MEVLKQQISNALPATWTHVSTPTALPEGVAMLNAVTCGARRIALLFVHGQMKSAMPLFDANSQLRKLGFETVWLFKGRGIPSTKHMLCTAVVGAGDEHAVSILNTDGRRLIHSPPVSVPDFTSAAAEHRIKSVDFSAGQWVDVAFTAEERQCSECNLVIHDVEHAIFYPLGEMQCPGLALPRDKLGRSVSKLISDALASHLPPADTTCSACLCQSPAARSTRFKVTSSVASVKLSRQAAFELIRHQKTTWYII